MTTRQNQQQELRGALAQRAASSQGQGKKTETIFDLVERLKPEVGRALPKQITPERFTRIALTELRRNPKLQACNAQSLLGALMICAQLGLEPGPLGHAYLVPYGSECQFILGYKGMIDLMWRSDMYESLSVHEVCEHDEFQFEYGLNEVLRHKPALTGRGTVICYYLVARYKNGGRFVYVMSVEDIEKHRARSRSGHSGPWQTDYDAMARKTVVREAARWMPVSIEIQRQLAQDGSIKTDLMPDMTESPSIIDVAPEDVKVGEAEAAGAEVAAGQGQTAAAMDDAAAAADAEIG